MLDNILFLLIGAAISGLSAFVQRQWTKDDRKQERVAADTAKRQEEERQTRLQTRRELVAPIRAYLNLTRKNAAGLEASIFARVGRSDVIAEIGENAWDEAIAQTLGLAPAAAAVFQAFIEASYAAPTEELHIAVQRTLGALSSTHATRDQLKDEILVAQQLRKALGDTEKLLEDFVATGSTTTE